MKLAVISDIHDNLVNLQKCLAWCEDNDVNIMACCGDIATSETLSYLAENFKNKIYLVGGNMEIYNKTEVDLYNNIDYLGRFGSFKLAGKEFGLCHEPAYINKIMEDYSVDYIFYGHTHKPWIQKRDLINIVNPGTLGGIFSKATFAVYDFTTDKLDLKILELL